MGVVSSQPIPRSSLCSKYNMALEIPEGSKLKKNGRGGRGGQANAMAGAGSGAL